MTTKEIYCFIGHLLAKGMSDQEIIDVFTNPLPDYYNELLMEVAPTQLVFEPFEIETIIEHLKVFYTQWRVTEEKLALEPTDLLNWHRMIRYKLLQLAIIKGAPSAALQIVESLAMLQGVGGLNTAATTPITIKLIPRIEDDDDKET